MATYGHVWELGMMTSTVTAFRAMWILQSRPNDIFPFTVKGRAGETAIKFGSTYELINTTGPFNSFWTGPDPVKVTTQSALSFTFTTLAGHHREAGQTITFETHDRLAMEDDGLTMRMHVYLTQYGTYISSFSHPFSSLFNIGANIGASGAWALQAHNLRDALGTLGEFEKAIIPGKRTVFPQW
jgi:hypothetical protein